MTIDPKIELSISAQIQSTYDICNRLFNLDDVEILFTFNKEACEGFEAVTMPALNSYLIAINPEVDWQEPEFVKTIAHELIHVKQFTYDGLDFEAEDTVMFRGSYYRLENDMEYWLSPWEIEARGYENAIWVMYQGENE